MPRQHRLDYPGALHHVFTRGNNRTPLFVDDEDCEMRLDLLRETSVRFGWSIYSVTLMRNHDHNVIHSHRGNLSRGMQSCNERYVNYFNEKYDMTGVRVEERFGGHLVEALRYLRHLPIYLDLNAVRAGFVEDPREYEWSSCQALCGGLPGRFDFIDQDGLLQHFGQTDRAARRNYAQHLERAFKRGIEAPWKNAHGGVILGSIDFLRQLEQRFEGSGDERMLNVVRAVWPAPTLDVIKTAVCDAWGRPAWGSDEKCRDGSRQAAILLATDVFGHSCKLSAEAVGLRSVGNVARARQRFRSADEGLLGRYNAARDLIAKRFPLPSNICGD